jgi:hypothetical protein
MLVELPGQLPAKADDWHIGALLVLLLCQREDPHVLSTDGVLQAEVLVVHILEGLLLLQLLKLELLLAVLDALQFKFQALLLGHQGDTAFSLHLLQTERVQIAEEAVAILEHRLYSLILLERVRWLVALLKDLMVWIEEVEQAKEPLLLGLALPQIHGEADPSLAHLLVGIALVVLYHVRYHFDQVVPRRWMEDVEITNVV